jgi:L-arabinokinase
MNIAVYVSAHGYGHTTRSWEIARAMVTLYPDTRVFFTGWAPSEMLAAEAHPNIVYRRFKLDVGVHQSDSLTMDVPGTLKDLAELEAISAKLVESEAEFLHREKISAALIDMPPLAFEAAARAGVPAFALGNFSWDWIYQAYAREYPALKPHIKRIRKAYRSAKLLFRLPFYGRMDALRPAIEVPLVARTSELGRNMARSRLGLNETVPVVLFSFGGFGLLCRQVSSYDDSRQSAIENRHHRSLAIREESVLISTAPSPDPGKPFRHLTDSRLPELGLRYPDLVAASDVVVSKPGYGIVSECIANDAALLYLPRGRFREYPILIREMKPYLRTEQISLEDLALGSWVSVMNRVMRAPRPESMDCSGAEDVARRIVKICG